MSSLLLSLLHSLQFMVRSRASLHLEIIALRHQLAVVHRSRRSRLRLTSADRALWAWLCAGVGWLALGRDHRQAGAPRIHGELQKLGVSPEDPKVDHALDAMSAPELRAAIRVVLDQLDEGVKASVIDVIAANYRFLSGI